MEDRQEFYAEQGIVTDPGEYRYLFNDLPDDIPSLCKIVQGLILHMHWAEAYGVKLSDERREEANLRCVIRQLKRIIELDDSPLTIARPLERKVVGNCRDFAVFTTSILRHKGVPARARCGFGTYFTPNYHEDHWICQYWNADEVRWVTVDSQIDDLMHEVLHITFDVLDMPEGKFIPAGRAWQMCRNGKADSETFGIFDMHGMWFIRGNLIRDMLALNKIELLPWDQWNLMPKDAQEEASAEEIELLDRIASITRGDEPDISELRSLYASLKELHPAENW